MTLLCLGTLSGFGKGRVFTLKYMFCFYKLGKRCPDGSSKIYTFIVATNTAGNCPYSSLNITNDVMLASVEMLLSLFKKIQSFCSYNDVIQHVL